MVWEKLDHNPHWRIIMTNYIYMCVFFYKSTIWCKKCFFSHSSAPFQNFSFATLTGKLYSFVNQWANRDETKLARRKRDSKYYKKKKKIYIYISVCSRQCFGFGVVFYYWSCTVMLMENMGIMFSIWRIWVCFQYFGRTWRYFARNRFLVERR